MSWHHVLSVRHILTAIVFFFIFGVENYLFSAYAATVGI
jgi:hypothetical protein